ncbi:transmembrane protease serine 6 isoform X2 [Nematostella vectensis]|uniref:transmembrane protease serine 6 isoform X2 n=1 Tax=Nematostella vectensis TaxID=45351 RepID=UPI002077973A|nr:transmembrane protease serine 6 isoform X2 [Nematostella vectensis]
MEVIIVFLACLVPIQYVRANFYYRPIIVGYGSAVCMDTPGVNCRAYQRFCRYSRFQQYMKANCAKSCGYCAVASSCRDKNYNCASWALNGECIRNARYMVPNCPRSCKKCPVEGSWGMWGSFSACTKTCNKGTKTRYRFCNNPKPANGGQLCLGSARQVAACNTQPCATAINGNWSPWSSFSPCSKSCGRGLQSRTRQCNNPSPSNGGSPCVGLAKEQKDCNLRGCPVDGKWGKWSNFYLCSKTCGNGVRTRYRLCNNPVPINGGRTCSGESRENAPCKVADCGEDVDGNWSEWSRWSDCTRTCNGGHTLRSRKCNNPTPQGGGRVCAGEGNQEKACNTQRCGAKPVLAPFICGVRNALGRIVGGQTAKVEDWPWQAGLKKGLDDTIVCGGSLINREWVVTAAHCIDRNNPSRTGCVVPDPPIRVILGESDVTKHEGNEIHRDVAQICIHPDYHEIKLTNDLALIRLRTPITTFTKHVRPVCLPTSATPDLAVGTNCTVTGYGRVGENEDLSTQLRHATIPVLSVSECRANYSGHTINDKVICAGYEGGKIDSCKGDSGGPFVCKDPRVTSRFILHGAVSWGVGCARKGQPGIYTDIKKYLNWIDNIVKNV